MLLPLLIIILIVYLTKNKRIIYSPPKYRYYRNQYKWTQQQAKSNSTNKTEKNYISGYQKTPLLSHRETEAYKRIKEIADERGYTVFTKVRLLDLAEPIDIHQKDQSYLYKIWSKHVDFVVCDEKLDAKWIIELQDSSHERKDRIERDNLVKAILSNCNYKIIMTYTADKEEIKTFLERQPKNIVC